MKVNDIPRELEAILLLSGYLDGVKVGGRTKPSEDIPRLCEIIQTFYRWMAAKGRSRSVQISALNKRVTDLEAEVKALKKDNRCQTTTTPAPDAGQK